MGLFNCLPRVDKCCCCVGLKLGSIFISICGILSLLSIGFMFSGYKGSRLEATLDLFKYASSIIQIIFGIMSIIVLVGLLMDRTGVCEWWLLSCAVYVLVMLLYAVLGSPIFYSDITNSKSWASTLIFLITPAAWIYAMCVVNSYV